MKILFNCTNNTVGGAIQNAANFIRLAVFDNRHEFIFLVSKEVESLLLDWNVNMNSIISFDRKKNLSVGVDRILEIENDFAPDLIYTMAGPTYINFKKTHIMGISDGYITHSNLKNFFFNRSVVSSLKMLLKTIFKGIFTKFSADFIIFQTETARQGFCKRYFFNINNTFVVSNSINKVFLEEIDLHCYSSNKYSLSEDFVYILCPSAYYSHKDIEILFKVSSLLEKNTNIRFILTIDNKNYEYLIKKFPRSDSIIVNLGPYSYSNVLEIYTLADAVILPSTLETFSTTYIEAIALKIPLIVVDADFSKEICGNYALYFESGNASSLLDILKKGEFLNGSINFNEREKIILKYGTQEKRYQSLIQILENINR